MVTRRQSNFHGVIHSAYSIVDYYYYYYYYYYQMTVTNLEDVVASFQYVSKFFVKKPFYSEMLISFFVKLLTLVYDLCFGVFFIVLFLFFSTSVICCFSPSG